MSQQFLLNTSYRAQSARRSLFGMLRTSTTSSSALRRSAVRMRTNTVSFSIQRRRRKMSRRCARVNSCVTGLLTLQQTRTSCLGTVTDLQGQWTGTGGSRLHECPTCVREVSMFAFKYLKKIRNSKEIIICRWLERLNISSRRSLVYFKSLKTNIIKPRHFAYQCVFITSVRD